MDGVTSSRVAPSAFAEVLEFEQKLSATSLLANGGCCPFGANFLMTMLQVHRQKALIAEFLKVVANQVDCSMSPIGLGIGELGAEFGHWGRAAAVSPIVAADDPRPCGR